MFFVLRNENLVDNSSPCNAYIFFFCWKRCIMVTSIITENGCDLLVLGVNSGLLFFLLKDSIFTADSREQSEEFSRLKMSNMKDTSDEIDHAHSQNSFTNCFAADINSLDDPISQFMEAVPRSENGSAGDRPEMFLPGLVIHIVRQQKSIRMPLCNGLRFQKSSQSCEAYIANRESFKDIIVSPSMFLDHLPWRYPTLFFLVKILNFCFLNFLAFFLLKVFEL